MAKEKRYREEIQDMPKSDPKWATVGTISVAVLVVLAVLFIFV
jgi:preprotein translocase subunit Sec61beta